MLLRSGQNEELMFEMFNLICMHLQIQANTMCVVYKRALIF